METGVGEVSPERGRKRYSTCTPFGENDAKALFEQSETFSLFTRILTASPLRYPSNDIDLFVNYGNWSILEKGIGFAEGIRLECSLRPLSVVLWNELFFPFLKVLRRAAIW